MRVVLFYFASLYLHVSCSVSRWILSRLRVSRVLNLENFWKQSKLYQKSVGIVAVKALSRTDVVFFSVKQCLVMFFGVSYCILGDSSRLQEIVVRRVAHEIIMWSQ